MERAPQVGSPGFIRTPAAPSELVLKGMETVKAALTARFARRREEDAGLAGLRTKLAEARRDIVRKSGVDLAALTGELRKLRRHRAARQSFARLPGMQSEVPFDLAGVSGYSVVTPPYDYSWTNTGYVHYGPGTLTANADVQTGTLGIVDQPDPSSVQENVSNAQAAVGIYFRPEVVGALRLQTIADISEYYGYFSLDAGANTHGWAGFLVQAYEGGTNLLVETPVFQETTLFDVGAEGGIFPSGNNYDFPNLSIAFTAPTFSVIPSRWYALWFWCGGDIHAQGLLYQDGPEDSTAYCTIDASVPYFVLDFTPIKLK